MSWVQIPVVAFVVIPSLTMDDNEQQQEQRELLKQLRERIKQLRMQELFEEPSTYEDEWDDDY